MEEAVSCFIAGTCQLFTNVCLTKLHNLLFEIALKESTSAQSKFCIVGSAAEFYIQPIQQNIRDIDVILYSDETIAFEEDDSTRVISKLNGYGDTITCYALESYSHLPGYVRLRLLGILAYDWRSERYTFQEQDASQYLSNDFGIEPRQKSTGRPSVDQAPWKAVANFMPALSERGASREHCYARTIPEFSDNTVLDETLETSQYNTMMECTENAAIGTTVDMNLEDTTQTKAIRSSMQPNVPVQHRIPVDIVHSIRCPLWPKWEAMCWMFRPRPSGWPSKKLIEEVVEAGCDVVPGMHSSCEEPELLWRLSFSRSEVLLVRHWTSVQQTVYHMLRYFVRRNSTLKDCRRRRDRVLNTYHLKTLMLWSCETQSSDWWVYSSLLVICCRLLSVLCEWLRQNHCPHYFVSDCNLFNSETSEATRNHVLRTLENFQETSRLSQWFVQNYVLPLHQKLCKSKDVEMNLRAVEHTMLLACQFVKKRMLEELEYWIVTVSSAFRLTLSSFCPVGLRRTSGSSKLLTEGVDCFSEFTQYLLALNLLHTVGFVRHRKGLLNECKIYEVIGDIFCRKSLQSLHGYPLSYVDFISPGKVYLTKALELMSCLTGPKSTTEFRLLAKLSIECLKASLTLQAPDIDDNYCNHYASLGYLAALHNAIGENDVAERLGSWLEFKLSTDNTPRGNYLNGFLMLYIDDVSNILGFLWLLHPLQKHRAINNKEMTTMSTFSVELFVKYLKLQIAVDNKQKLMLEAIRENETWTLADRLLYSTIDYKLRRHASTTTSVSVEDKTLVYARLTSRRFSLSDCYVLTDIELEELMMKVALERLGSFFQSVSETFDVRCNTAVCYRALYLYSLRRYEEVLTLCEKLIQDEYSPLLEMQSPCFAVTTTPPFDKFYDRDLQALLGFGYLFDRCCSKDKSTENIVDLPVFGYSIYKRKLIVLEMNKKTFITGRFIANYLKVRCLLDMKYSFSEIAVAYHELKGRLPFEHIVRQFVIRKLCRHVKTSDSSRTKPKQMKTTKSLIFNQLTYIM